MILSFDTYKNRLRLIFSLCFAILAVTSFSQPEKKYIRKGNREYEKGKYPQSEILYRKAGDGKVNSPEVTFNIGDALYKQKKFEDAGKQFVDNTTQTVDAEKQSAGYYNLGNSLLQADKLKESIEAYKNSLKLNPSNNMAKYNLGYAQNLLKKQEQQQQQQQQQQNQKNDQQQDNKNQNDQQQKDKNQPPDKQQQQDQQQQLEQGISKEDAERLLNALANDEKKVQEKVKREKAARTRTRTLKNW
ncbi:MAG TPA: tetratricopeptide repeat protein [Bacteroidales bacterium]|nr:tetratricopeptide repeat protein [Bacteroidales bacterium]